MGNVIPRVWRKVDGATAGHGTADADLLQLEPRPLASAVVHASVDNFTVIETPAGARVARALPRLMVCGDCGLYVRRLLSQRPVDVLTAADVETALPMHRGEACSAYVIPWQWAEGCAEDLISGLSETLPRPLPCVVLVDALEGRPAERSLAAGASVVRRDDVAGLLTELAHWLSTPVGDGARVPFVSPVTIRREGQEADVEATDLRPGGIGVRGVPFELGPVPARLSFVLGEQLIELWGVSVREWRVYGAWHTAFRFIGLSPERRRWLRDQVEPMEEAGAFEPQQTVTSEWRREVRALVTLIRRPLCPWGGSTP